MTKERLSDNENRKKILEGLNPRKEIPNEATNRINPLTGRPYLDDPSIDSWINPYLEKYVLKNYMSKDITNIMYKESYKPQTNDFIEYQLALARMDVREGKMSSFDYSGAERLIKKLVDRMNKSNVPLSLISSANGLDQALS